MIIKADITRPSINVSINMDEAIERAAEIVADAARADCPVDTGTLKNSISVSANGKSATISANADYARYVEFGTSKMAAQPFLVPAIINSKDKIANMLIEAVEVTL